MDRGAWRATVHGVTKSGTGLSKQHFLRLGFPGSNHRTACRQRPPSTQVPAFAFLLHILGSVEIHNTTASAYRK